LILIARLLNPPRFRADQAALPGNQTEGGQSGKRALDGRNALAAQLGEVSMARIEPARLAKQPDEILANPALSIGDAAGAAGHFQSGAPDGALFAVQRADDAGAEGAAVVIFGHSGDVLGLGSEARQGHHQGAISRQRGDCAFLQNWFMLSFSRISICRFHRS